MLQVLRSRTYGRLFRAQVCALLGTGLLTVGLGLIAFTLAGEAAGSVLGTALMIKMIAYVMVAPLVGALVDRMPAKGVLIAADLVRLIIAAVLPLVTEPWQIYVLIFVLQSASATFTPTFQALIPAVLPDPEDYTRALSLSRLAYDLETLLSPTIAAVLLRVVADRDLFLGTAVGFALSAALVGSARLPARTGAPESLTFWHRLTTGTRVFVRTPTLRFVLFTNVAVAAGTALVLVNSVVYARGVFGRDETALALALACFGIGSLAVAANIPRLVVGLGVINTMSVGAVVIVSGLALTVGLTMIATVTGAGWPALLGTWTLLGMGISMVNTPSSRLLAEASTPADRTLVYTAQFALSHACFLLMYPLAGWLGATDLAAAAIVLTALAAAAAVMALRIARSTDTAAALPR